MKKLSIITSLVLAGMLMLSFTPPSLPAYLEGLFSSTQPSLMTRTASFPNDTTPRSAKRSEANKQDNKPGIKDNSVIEIYGITVVSEDSIFEYEISCRVIPEKSVIKTESGRKNESEEQENLFSYRNELMNSLHEGKLIELCEHSFSFELSSVEMVVNGKKIDNAIHQKFKDRYIKSQEDHIRISISKRIKPPYLLGIEY
jgi:hypothetical protein